MGPPPVVVLDVHGEHVLQLSAAEDEHPVQTLGPDRADPPLGEGVGPRCPDGEGITSVPSERKTSSKPEVYLESRALIRNRTGVSRSARSYETFLACWVTQAESGLALTPAAWTRRVDLNEGQDVERLEEQGLHREEVAGQDPSGLGPQELRPAWTRSARRGTQALSAKKGPDGGGGDPDAELGELALDPDAAPRAVLPPQPKDQLAGVWVKGRPPSDALPSVGPLPPHQLPVPPEQGPRTHHEGGPGRAGKRSAGRREHHAVEPTKAGPASLTPEDLRS